MKRTRLVSIALVFMLGCALMIPAAVAGHRDWRHRPYHHSYHHPHFSGFWPGLAIGMGAAVLGSSIYYAYNFPRYVVVEPPVGAAGPCPGDRPYPPCRRYEPGAPYDDDRGEGLESRRPQPDEPENEPDAIDDTSQAEDRTSENGHYYTETYGQDGYYDPDGRWVAGRYIERSRQWVNSGPSN